MKPMRSRRSSVSFLSLSPVTSVSPRTTCPLVGVSSAARQCMRVDLPDPDGPITAVNSPTGKSRLTPSSARTAVSPLP